VAFWFDTLLLLTTVVVTAGAGVDLPASTALESVATLLAALGISPATFPFSGSDKSVALA